MKIDNTKPIGLTKSAGFQMGLRKTFPVKHHDAWERFFSEEGVNIWLGKIDSLAWREGESYKTSSGVEGLVKVFKPFSHVRMTWKKKSWNNFSALQIRILPGKDKSTISFHQDKLMDENQREEMLLHWEKVMEKIEKMMVQ